MSGPSLFVTPESRPAAETRLICFPFAGGDINTYLPWLPLLDRPIELVIVQLPGRGRRARERAFTRMNVLVEELFGNMLTKLDRPFAFFGHSMGSKIAYELAIRLQNSQLPVPEFFFASGSGSPCLPRRGAQIHRLPDSQFLERIRKLSGVPQQVLESRELMAFMLPMLRADFKLVETYVGKFEALLPSRLIVMGGRQDAVVAFDDLRHWTELFLHADPIKLYEGGHFFLNQHIDDIVRTINTLLIDRPLMNQAS